MRRAHARSAHRTQTFWFRKHMGAPAAGTVGDPDEYEEMTVEEILTGKGEYFPGLMPLVRAYLEAIGCDPETGEKVGEYMELIRLRATGELKTAAEWMRARMMAHPEYNADSEVSAGMAYDLLRACSEVSEGRQSAPDLLGKHWVRPLKVEDAWYKPLTSAAGKQDYSALLARYVRQADPKPKPNLNPNPDPNPTRTLRAAGRPRGRTSTQTPTPNLTQAQTQTITQAPTLTQTQTLTLTLTLTLCRPTPRSSSKPSPCWPATRWRQSKQALATYPLNVAVSAGSPSRSRPSRPITRFRGWLIWVWVWGGWGGGGGW